MSTWLSLSIPVGSGSKTHVTSRPYDLVPEVVKLVRGRKVQDLQWATTAIEILNLRLNADELDRAITDSLIEAEADPQWSNQFRYCWLILPDRC